MIKEGLDESRLTDLRGEIRDLKIDINLAEDYLEKLKKRAQKKLEEIHQRIYISLIILDAARSFDKVGSNFHISGWVPNDFIPALEKEITKACPSQKVKISISSPDSDLDEKHKKRGFVKIPTCLKNPFFLKPFEKLVFGYDIPDYHEVEPTLFFALGFLLMFGVMFGDVGHGLVLFLLGLCLAKKIKKGSMVQIGHIAMECGVMSIIFGFLYGSVFGFEHILPALWFHPMENIYYFMKVTIGFGIGFISLGLLLNIINSIRNKDFLKGIFGELGIMGLLFYWGCIGLLILYTISFIRVSAFALAHAGLFLAVFAWPIPYKMPLVWPYGTGQS